MYVYNKKKKKISSKAERKGDKMKAEIKGKQIYKRKLIFIFKWEFLSITGPGAEPGTAQIHLCTELTYAWL